MVRNDKDVGEDDDVGGEEIGHKITGNWATPHSPLSSFYPEEKARSFSQRESKYDCGQGSGIRQGLTIQRRTEKDKAVF